jgi:hypothetical protein
VVEEVEEIMNLQNLQEQVEVERVAIVLHFQEEQN